MGEPGTQGVGESLRHLVKICHADGNVDEEEAYAAILADFMDEQSSMSKQVASSKPGKSWRDVEHTSDSHPVSERPDTNFGETRRPLASVIGTDEARDAPSALPAPSELFRSQQFDSTSAPDIRLPILSPGSKLTVTNSSILYDAGSLLHSYLPTSELMINTSPHQDGFRQAMSGPIPLPNTKSETTKVPQGYSVNTPSVKSEEIYELEGDQFMGNALSSFLQGPPHTQTRSALSRSDGFPGP